MAQQKEPTISYSDVYYRPVDTPVAAQGWYVDKYITRRINNLTIEQDTKIIAFPDEAAARKFARSHGGVRELPE